MKNLLLSILLLLFTHLSFAQTSKSQLEVMPYMRFDSYSEFSYNYKDRTNSDYLEVKGISWGTNINYKHLLRKNIFIKAGLGYYRYSFNTLKGISIWGETKSRPINYNSEIEVLYYTDGYWYNCVSLNVGLEKAIPLSKNLQVITSLNFSNYYTYAQNYHLGHNDSNFKVNNKKSFGYSGYLNLGITKTINDYSFGPFILMPIYTSWMKDKLFDETTTKNEAVNKWFRGWGMGLTFSKNIQI